MAKHLMDMTLIYRLETDRALCVALDGEHDDVWIPKPQIEWEFTGKKTPLGNRLVTVTLPDELAKEKGLT